MDVNGKILFLLFLQTLVVVSARFKWRQFLSHEYSWLATMVYSNGHPFVYCGGAVISDQFVLTAAQCVTGKRVDDMGGLARVRLGDYTKSPYCVYGTSNCHSFLEFDIANIKTHENFERNDIALVRLKKAIEIGHQMKSILLPHQTPHPVINTQLTVSGSVLTISPSELLAQRFKYFSVKQANMLTGLLVAPVDNVKNARGSYSGRHMVIEAIVSFREMRGLPNYYTPSNYTRVANYLAWIKNNMAVSDIVESEEPPINSTTNPQEPEDIGTVVHRFPEDCGDSPIYPRELLDSGYKIEPDEFSWLASLVYEKNSSAFGHCSGSVISARYVLTTRNCVIHKKKLGKPVGVRLGVFDNESFCDYGTQSCQQFQYFRIVDTKVVRNSAVTKNNLALIKLDRDIVFGPKMKPICLPFDETHIPPPFEGSFLTVTGWWTTTYPNDVIAKRSAAVAFWNITSCFEAALDKDKQVCGVKPGTSPCTVELGSPLMNMFERRRMVLEGIAYGGVGGCPGPNVANLYTRVRSFKNWIKNSIQELETKGTSDQISNKNKGYKHTRLSG